MDAIDIIAVAQRLEAARLLHDPRLSAELERDPAIAERMLALWRLSHEPGGLCAYTRQLVERQADRIGTPTMRRLADAKQYSPLQLLQIWGEIPSYLRERVHPESWRVEQLFQTVTETKRPVNAQSGDDWEDAGAGPDDLSREGLWARRHRGSPIAQILLNDPQLAQALADLTPDALRAFCLDRAGNGGDIACHFAASCVRAGESANESPWYFTDLCLRDDLEQRAQQIIGAIASTRVWSVTRDALDCCHATGQTAMLYGPTKWGKSFAAVTYHRAYPGRAIYVTVPDSNRPEDIVRAVARGLCLDPFACSAARLQDTVQTILKAFKPVVVFDEAHLLLPTVANRHASPRRLNWVRLELIKQGIPVALIATPQSFQQSLENFVRATNYEIAQFTGSIGRYPKFPDNISFDELVAIGRVHFPKIHQDYIELIASKAQQYESFVDFVSALAINAAWRARRAGRSEADLTQEDIEAAIAETCPPVFPLQAQPAPVAARRRAGRKQNTSGAVPSDIAASQENRVLNYTLKGETQLPCVHDRSATGTSQRLSLAPGPRAKAAEPVNHLGGGNE